MNKYSVARALCLALLAFCGAPSGAGAESNGFVALRIAHAGGALGRKKYTNSYQALDENLQRGFRYFELDFVFTADDHLVCLHDWRNHFKRTFGFDTDQPLTLEAFERLVDDNSHFTNCTLDGLADWMRQNPQAVIITDVKENNLVALQQISRSLPAAGRRVIPQIYTPANLDAVQAMGFERVIWTLYRWRGSNYQVVEWARRGQGAIAVTMPRVRASTPLPRVLAGLGVPTYVHTINKRDELMDFTETYRITEIYTDFLGPDTDPEPGE